MRVQIQFLIGQKDNTFTKQYVGPGILLLKLLSLCHSTFWRIILYNFRNIGKTLHERLHEVKEKGKESKWGTKLAFSFRCFWRHGYLQSFQVKKKKITGTEWSISSVSLSNNHIYCNRANNSSKQKANRKVQILNTPQEKYINVYKIPQFTISYIWCKR